jgi:hypothetical protein
VVSFTALAVALRLIAFVYDGWGFDTLFFSPSRHSRASSRPTTSPYQGRALKNLTDCYIGSFRPE